jgi:hypothetical protein
MPPKKKSSVLGIKKKNGRKLSAAATASATVGSIFGEPLTAGEEGTQSFVTEVDSFVHSLSLTHNFLSRRIFRAQTDERLVSENS